MDTRAAARLPRLLLAAAVALAWVVAHSSWQVVRTSPPVAAWQVAAVAVLVVATLMWRLETRIGSQRVVFTWIEASVALGVLLLPAPWLTLATAPAVLIAMIAQRHSREKILLNTAAVTFGAWLAAQIYCFVSDGRPISAATVCGAVLAAATYTVVTDITVSSAIAFSHDLRVRDVMVDGWQVQVLTTAGNISAAVVFLVLLRWEPVLLLALPPLLYATHSAYRHRLDAGLERETWRRLASGTAKLMALPAEAIIDTAVAEVRAFFTADEVALELIAPPPSADAPFETHVPAHFPSGPRRDPPHRHRVVQDVADAAGIVGRLVLTFSRDVTLTERETAALSTYCTALAAALRNAAMYREQRHAARHDPLTGLPNRTMLLEAGTAALARASSPPLTGNGSGIALLLLDLNHFKVVNDALGHHAGDELLCSVASRLRSAIGTDDVVARLGGDEFAVLLTHLPDVGSAARRATQLAALLTEPCVVDGFPISAEASVGVACSFDQTPTLSEMLRRADIAMYQAKATGTSTALYEDSYETATLERVGLLAELRDALSNDEFVLHFQPQVDLRTHRMNGAEALVRWQHPRRGLLPPAQFVPYVEATGLIWEFTLHVLTKALAEARRWADGGVAVPVAVNLSARTLLNPALPQRVSQLLAEHSVPPDQLVLEITETAAMTQLDIVEDVLSGLAATGVRLSVDDFGTGYSSLTFLSRTTVHELKIDRSFTAALLRSPRDAAIVRATIELARNFDLRVVAEGIERSEEVDALVALGCTTGQGFYFARPMSSEAIFEWLVAAQSLVCT